MSLTLSILVPTIPERAELLARLLKNITDNQGDKREGVDYEVLVHCTPPFIKRGPSTGVKRNELLAMARGEYTWFVDDDDLLMNSSISSVIDLARTEKRDMVAVCGLYTRDGKKEIKWFIRKDYGNDTVDGAYHRPPNHITPVRREIALQCKFPDITAEEDTAYSEQLVPLLKTESILSTPAYHYQYSSRNKLYRILRKKILPK
jgi:glycosyltransferase involved in cell wall biosynthesis